jgi:predicted RNA-binding Zn ribbon-like protein
VTTPPSEAPGKLELVRELVNSRDVEQGTDAIATAAGLAAWLAAHGLATRGVSVTEADVARAVEVREALRALALANNGAPLAPEAAAALDAQARRANVGVAFRADGSAPLEPSAGGVDGALGTVLGAVAEAIHDGSFRRLKACRADTCQWAYYDGSRNGTRRWCSMDVCGNRTKVRAFRARHAAARDA